MDIFSLFIYIEKYFWVLIFSLLIIIGIDK
nr:MAG TPA: hypothetical protein [Bacteriophage sp.]